MAELLGFPLIFGLLSLQTVVVSHLPLLNGTADLILLALAAWALQERVKTAWIWALWAGLLVSFVSATPFMAPLMGYLAVTAIARGLHQRVWQMPILAMFFMAFVGTFVCQGLTVLALQLNGAPISWAEGLSRVIMPSALLNLIFSLPIYAVVSDLANWLYPAEVAG